MDTAAERLELIRHRMERARQRFGAPPEHVELVAVSKTFPAEDVVPFLDAGQRMFGENRVQEAASKWPALRQSYEGIELHLIGPLQTNKVKQAIELFDVIETVDRDKLAEHLGREFARTTTRPGLYVQVNIGREPQKAGVDPADAVAFVRRCEALYGLTITGLMAMPPDAVPPGPYFAVLANLADEAAVPNLSMGMSGDFETAIALGATHVRVGSALFGRRS